MPDHSQAVVLALAHIASADWADDCEKVSAYYAERVRALYKENKDVGGMLALGRAGIAYQLGEAERVAVDDAALAVRLRTAAKTLAFNVAANCWPGWGDDGVVIEAADIEEGLGLAKLSLGLVQELALGHDRRGNAFWLVGALNLAAGRYSAAITAFDQSRENYVSGGAALQVLLVDGYREIAVSLAAGGDGSNDRLDGVIGKLQQDGSQKAKFFIGQLQTAARILRDRLRR